MLYFILAVLALIVGSFLNVVIYRFPIMLENAYRKDCATILDIPPQANMPPEKEFLNLCFPRSFCPECKAQISALSNIPLISFIIQKGKCRQCHKKISLQYPLVELLSLVLALACAFSFGFTPKGAAALVFVWMLIPLFFIDLKHHLLPDELTIGLLWIGLLVNTQAYFCTLQEAVIGAGVGYLVLWVLVKAFYLITGRIGMGHGDFKLFAALGAWVGWLMLPLMLLCASVLGIIIGVLYLHATNQSKNTPIPFGPYLCAAGVTSIFYGHNILSWYLNYTMI